MNSRGRLAGLGLALLATVGVAACTAHPAGNSASQPASQAASAPVAAGAGTSTATGSASPPAGTPGATTGQGVIQNLVVTSAELGQLTAAFVAGKGISLTEVAGGGPRPGTVYYAYDPATGTYWASAEFMPVSGLSLSAVNAFEGSGNIGMYRKAGTGSWQIQTGASSLGCLAPRFFPKAVLIAWSLPTAPSCQF